MIGAWTGRSPQSTEFPKTETDGVRRLLEVIKRQGIELGEKTTNLFRTAGITITETLMTFANNVRVEGDLSATGTMTVTGDATFEGNLAVPNGSITNDALQNPVEIASQSTSNTGMAIPATATELVSYTFAVPPGFSQATFFITGAGRCTNSTSGPQYFFGQTHAEASNGNWAQGGTQQVTLNASYQGTIAAPLSSTIEVDSGGTLRVWVEAWGSAAMAAHGGNYVGLDVVVIFTR